MNRETSGLFLVSKLHGLRSRKNFYTPGQTLVKHWTKRLVMSAFVGLLFLTACAHVMPTVTPDHQATLPIIKETVRLTNTPTIEPTATTVPKLPGGPDELTEVQIHTPPKLVPIEEVAALSQVEQGPSLLTGEVMANVKKQFEDESSKLESLGYKVTVDQEEMDGEKTVLLSGYEYAASPKIYRWTIAGTTANGFVHATLGDKFAGDPGYVSEDSSFAEMVDGFGSEVIRTWELYGDNWTPVVRDGEGNLLAVFNFDTRQFELDQGKAKQVLGFEAEQSLATDEGILYFMEGTVVAFVNNEGTTHQLIAGMELREDGSIWGVDPETGKFEKQTLPEGIDPVKTIEKYAGPVEKDLGKILGLNEYGWAVTEFKDGQWVPFEREMKILGSNGTGVQLELEMFPEGMLDALKPEDLKPLYMGGLYTPSGKMTDQYLGMHFPVDTDGKLETGYLGTWDTAMHFYSGYVLGAVDQKNGVDGAWVVIEIPFKTQRQIVAYFIPSQGNYFNDLYGVHQENKDSKPGDEALVYDRIPILYMEMIARFKNPELRGHQIVFAQQIKDRGEEGNKRRDRVFQSLKDGRGDEDPGWNWGLCHLWVPEAFFKN